MKPVEKMPNAKNIPALHINIEGLKRHSFMCVFVPEPSLSADDRKLRSWLLHTMTTGARHYTKARELISLQDNADQARDGGAIFYVLDVSEQIEGCVMAMHRVCMAIKRMNATEKVDGFTNDFSESIGQLNSIRNQFEHMHSQIVASETGHGPISMAFGDEGRSIKFRKLKMETTRLHGLIEEAYRVIAGLYPAFNANSAPEAGGPVKLTMTATITVVDGKTDQENNEGSALGSGII